MHSLVFNLILWTNETIQDETHFSTPWSRRVRHNLFSPNWTAFYSIRSISMELCFAQIHHTIEQMLAFRDSKLSKNKCEYSFILMENFETNSMVIRWNLRRFWLLNLLALSICTETSKKRADVLENMCMFRIKCETKSCTLSVEQSSRVHSHKAWPDNGITWNKRTTTSTSSSSWLFRMHSVISCGRCNAEPNATAITASVRCTKRKI